MALPWITHPLIRSDKAAAGLSGSMGKGEINESHRASSLHTFTIRTPSDVYRSSHHIHLHWDTEMAGHVRAQGLCVPGHSWEITKENCWRSCASCGDIGWPNTGKTANALKSTTPSVRPAPSRVSFDMQLQVLVKGLCQTSWSYCWVQSWLNWRKNKELQLSSCKTYHPSFWALKGAISKIAAYSHPSISTSY